MATAIDLFGGFGGFTLGATMAGARVVYAANHWPLAVKVHALNHVDARHECQDLRQADWTKLPMYDLLLASPACQGHSEASQPNRRPYHDEMRATAWAVVDCVEVTRPKTLVIENVVQFREWALYPLWKQALGVLGYTLSEHVLTASQFGVPQRRQRLFITGNRGPRPILLRPQGTQKEPAFGPCIEWNQGDWRPIVEATPNAQARMLAARARHGKRCLSQHTTGHPGVSIDEPIRTITTKDQWVVVKGNEYRPLLITEVRRAMGFPDSYIVPEGTSRADATMGFGNAVCPPVAAAIVSQL